MTHTVPGRDDAPVTPAGTTGHGGDADAILEPRRHAEALEQTSPALAALLRRSEVRVTAQRFEEADREAIEAQRKYRSLASRAALAVLGTSVLNAALLAWVVWVPDLRQSAPEAAQALGISGALCAGLGAMWLHRLRQGRPLDRWMARRARAESARRAYFKQVASPNLARAAASSDLRELALLQLEYFQRYQVDVQLAFYRGRGQQHERAGDGTLRLGGVAVLLAMVSTLLGTANLQWLPLAALGVVGAALGAFASAREGAQQDLRNAERYGHTYQALLELKASFDEVRDAVRAEGHEPLVAYVDAVHDQLSLEHRQWMRLHEDMSVAVEKLESILHRRREAVPADE